MSATRASASQASALLRRLVVQPTVRLAERIEGNSAAKLSRVDSRMAEYIAGHETVGSDAATHSTKRFLREQSTLMHYRVVRFFSEARYLLSGQYIREYDAKKLVVDLRFGTKLMFLFIAGILVGRRTIYPPMRPDSPFLLELQHNMDMK